MKKIIYTLFLLSISTLIFAQNKKTEAPEFALRKAMAAYDKQDYGKALKYSEDAILYKKQKVDYELEVLTKALSPRKVQYVGDNIEAILKVLEERNEKECIKIITTYLKIHGIDFFEGSMEKMLSYINGTSVYPEAQKMIGDIYKLEGEYEFAEEYYRMALDNKDYFDIPDEKYDILYMLADISKLENDKNAMEVRLLNILTEDKYFADKALKNSMIRTIKLDQKDSVEKFFTLYRAESYNSLKAYNELTEYYYQAGDKEKTLHFAALFAITSFTKIYETVQIRNFAYDYEDFGTFLQEASYYPDIVQWGSDNYVWKSFNVLAKYTNEFGYNNFARELLKVLVQFSPERYWQQEAVLQLERIDLQEFEVRE